MFSANVRKQAQGRQLHGHAMTVEFCGNDIYDSL
jgi:hypothetical protein